MIPWKLVTCNLGCMENYILETNKIDFSNYTGKNVKVGIIDSGIDPSIEKIVSVKEGVHFFRGKNGIVQWDSDFLDSIGHGTACAGIIAKKAKDVEIYPVRIFESNLVADSNLFVEAIKWCVDQAIRVINVSLGTTISKHAENLRDICNYAYNNNVIIVAAENNMRHKSYPASFSNVFGVSAGRIRDKFGYYYRPNHSIEFVARGDNQRLKWLSSRDIFLGGTSFAAPHITALITLILEKLPYANFKQIKRILIENALSSQPELVDSSKLYAMEQLINKKGEEARDQKSSIKIEYELDWIGRAVLFPYNKEMHSLIRYQDLLPFEIVGVADIPGRMTINKDAGQLIGIPVTGLLIGSKYEVEFNKGDSVIFGYLDKISSIRKKNVLKQMVELAINMEKNVFSFYPLSGREYSQIRKTAEVKGLKIKWPSVTYETFRRVNENNMAPGETSVPVLGIFGTGPAQGKFTTQLCLRRWFNALGYKVAQIGTEHHSELFGFDFSFPIGYGSEASVHIPIELHIPLLESVIAMIDRNNPDIIIVGAQSGVIPFDFQDKSALYTLPSIAFLLGTKPDAYVLVVNSIDHLDYITDSINVLKALGKGKIVALVFSDKKKDIRSGFGRDIVIEEKMSEREISSTIKRLENRFNLPVAEVISQNGQAKIVNAVINFFSDEQDDLAYRYDSREVS